MIIFRNPKFPGKLVPCAIKIERSRPPYGHKSESVGIEINGLGNGLADEGDVVQRSEVQGISQIRLHFPEKKKKNSSV